MKKKIFFALCFLGILSFLVMAGKLHFIPAGNEPSAVLAAGLLTDKSSTAAKAHKAAESAKESQFKQSEQAPQSDNICPEKVCLTAPTVELNGKEGKLSYRWRGNNTPDSVLINDTAILISCDCYFPEERMQQKIFYVAEAPNFVPQEVFRQNSREYTDGIVGGPDLLEHRMISPLSIEGGFLYELDGTLYSLSADFQTSSFFCDLHALMGELYTFSPWVADENTCDVTIDASRLLACTDEGLYEYNLTSGEKTLLEPAVFLPYEIVHIEGDCDCGETGFEFSGPITAEYAPDDQGYVFVTGDEYGGEESITLKSADGETLYHKELDNLHGDFIWMETEDSVCMAFFYQLYQEEDAWMDLTDVSTGETATFSVPPEVFIAEAYVSFWDADTLIYCKEYIPSYRESLQEKSTYAFCRFRNEPQSKQVPVSSAASIKKRLVLLGSDYILVKEGE